MAYSDYWARRSLEREAVYRGGSEKTIATMQGVYRRAFDNIKARIEAAEKQLGKKGGSEAEDAGAYYQRIAMLEDLQDKIYDECKRLENIERKVTGARYADVMAEGYYRNMFDIQRGVGLVLDFAKLPKQAIAEAMRDGWLGRNYSKSIWKNTEKLAGLVQEIVKAGFISGASIQTMVGQLDEVMQRGQFVTERLIRSETSYFANQGELRSYEQAGIERYEYLATLDNLTSKACIALDGEVFLVSEAEVGKNYPPRHAFCRSTTVAHFDDKAADEIRRRARDPVTGRLVVLDRNMNYGEWYDTYVKGKPESEVAFYTVKNREADEKQFERYKDLLGSNTPETFAEFQTLKYNTTESWNTLKDYYYAVSHGYLTPLASLADYTDIKKELDNELIGLVTSNGIKIESYSKHFIDRVIGSIEQRRSGVSIESVKQTLTNPVRVDDAVVNPNGKSQRFTGENARVTVNTDTGNLIQTNPRSRTTR